MVGPTMLLNGERLVYAEPPEESEPLYTRYYCSLPNIKGSSPPAHLYLDDDDLDREAKLVTFLQREDQPGRGIYYCIGLLKLSVIRVFETASSAD
jgi:hypothetical protein